MMLSVTRTKWFAATLLLATTAWAQEFSITTTSVPNGIINAPYSAQINSNESETFFTVSWSITSGALPPGIRLTVATGASATISGTPTALGTFAFVISASESSRGEPIQNGAQRVVKHTPFGDPSQALSITITPPPLTFNNTSPLPPAMVGMGYVYQFSASGGVPPYSFTDPVLPPGLQLSNSGGLSGTPTSSRANYNLNVTVTDSMGSNVTGHFALNVTPALVFNTKSPLPSGSAGSPYSQGISVTGGTTPYMFSINGNAPPGIGILNSGFLTGTPSAIGTYTFTVQVTDALNFTIGQQYTVTFAAGAPLLQVSPLALTFTAFTGGDTPLPQAISIVSSNASAVTYTTSVDAGTAGSAAPPWISISPTSAATPTRMLVSVIPSLLVGSSGKATIHVSVAQSTTQTPFNIAVTFTISSSTPTLQVLPPALRFGSRFAAPGIQQQSVIVDNGGGGGTQNFTVSVVGNSPWISVTPQSGTVGNNATAVVRITANSSGLAAGDHHDIVRITGPNTVDIPVDEFVANSGPILGLGVTGARFLARAGSGSSRPQSIEVLNLGDIASTVDWTADLLSGSDWLSISNSHGTATPTQPGSLVISESQSAFGDAAGPRYALVRVTDPNALNSPQYLTAVLDNQPSSSPAVPDPSPAGLYFTSKTGPQQVQIFTSSSTPTAFQVSALTNDGAQWLAVNPASGIASTSSPGAVTVSVTPPAVAGIYTGYVNIGMNGVVVVVNVTLVVLPAGVGENTPAERPLTTANCTPSQLAMTETGLVNNFSVPAGWPATLIAQLNDNCGNSVSNGSIVASFTNGDTAIVLRGDQVSNTYSATWQPGTILPSMSISLRASAGTLPALTQTFTGAVNSNPTPPPMLLSNGTLDIFFDAPTAAALGSGLAPGNVAQVYGTGLAASLVPASTTPLPPQIDGTYMLVGQNMAPLYFISSTVMAVEIPFELTAPQQSAAIASVNGALSNVITVTVVPNQPGIAVRPDGTAEAQHLDYSLINTASPAKPNETVIIYLAGMGATNPSVASGVETPGQLVPNVIPTTVTIDGQNVIPGYAGLTPTGIGLYQIDFAIPTNARSGNLNVTVTQNGVISNTAILAVSK